MGNSVTLKDKSQLLNQLNSKEEGSIQIEYKQVRYSVTTEDVLSIKGGDALVIPQIVGNYIFEYKKEQESEYLTKIKQKVGEKLIEKFQKITPCKPLNGDLLFTGAGDLPYKYLIHVFGSNQEEINNEEWLQRAFSKLLKKAQILKIKSLIIPELSKTFSCFNKKQCSEIFLHQSKKFIDKKLAYQQKIYLEEFKFVRSVPKNNVYLTYEHCNKIKRCSNKPSKLKRYMKKYKPSKIKKHIKKYKPLIKSKLIQRYENTPETILNQQNEKNPSINIQKSNKKVSLENKISKLSLMKKLKNIKKLQAKKGGKFKNLKRSLSERSTFKTSKTLYSESITDNEKIVQKIAQHQMQKIYRLDREINEKHLLMENLDQVQNLFSKPEMIGDNQFDTNKMHDSFRSIIAEQQGIINTLKAQNKKYAKQLSDQKQKELKHIQNTFQLQVCQQELQESELWISQLEFESQILTQKYKKTEGKNEMLTKKLEKQSQFVNSNTNLNQKCQKVGDQYQILIEEKLNDVSSQNYLLSRQFKQLKIQLEEITKRYEAAKLQVKNLKEHNSQLQHKNQQLEELLQEKDLITHGYERKVKTQRSKTTGNTPKRRTTNISEKGFTSFSMIKTVLEKQENQLKQKHTIKVQLTQNKPLSLQQNDDVTKKGIKGDSSTKNSSQNSEDSPTTIKKNL